MQFAKINRSNNETIYIAGQNVGANSLTTGHAVCLAVHAASVSRGGLALKHHAAAADGPHFIGVAAQDIAANAVGRVVVWGYAASVLISTSISNHTTIAPGEPMLPQLTATGLGAFTSAVTPTYALTGFKYVINMITVNVSTAGPVGQGYTSGWVARL